MASWQVIYTKDAVKDMEKAFAAGFHSKILSLIELLRDDPFSRYPAYEKLVGDLSGLYSRRINHKHRLVYSVDTERAIVKIVSTWTHYE